MTDLHSHFLPGIDDGAKNAAESIDMLKSAYSQGVSLCAATPHCVIHHDDSIEKFLEKRGKSYEVLMSEIRNRGAGSQIPEILTGAEIYLDNDISDCRNLKDLCITGTNVLLLELPTEKYDRRYADRIYSLSICGFTPLIAHIDRYEWYESLIKDIRGMKVVYQINASNFLSFFGRRRIKKILQAGYGGRFLVSSDMHNTSVRACNMAKAFEKSRHILESDGTAGTESLFNDCARRLISGEFDSQN